MEIGIVFNLRFLHKAGSGNREMKNMIAQSTIYGLDILRAGKKTAEKGIA